MNKRDVEPIATLIMPGNSQPDCCSKRIIISNDEAICENGVRSNSISHLIQSNERKTPVSKGECVEEEKKWKIKKYEIDFPSETIEAANGENKPFYDSIKFNWIVEAREFRYHSQNINQITSDSSQSQQGHKATEAHESHDIQYNFLFPSANRSLRFPHEYSIHLTEKEKKNSSIFSLSMNFCCLFKHSNNVLIFGLVLV